MGEKVIPVVFTPDEDYMLPTCVAILSMLKTKKKDTKYIFYFVISNNFDKKYFTYINKIQQIDQDFEYRIEYIDNRIFEKQKITTYHLSTSAYYRILLPQILYKYDKCMYHDGDILVNADLCEMYEEDLQDNYIAGVKAAVRHQDTKENSELMKVWKFPSFDNYILSGDLLFNLAKMRGDDMINEMIREMEKGFPSEDQDVINYCCYGKISFLPLKFCMMNRWIYNNALEGLKKQVHTSAEIAEAKDKPAIIHFAGANVKPWNNLRTAYGEQWWKYAKEILSSEEYHQLYKKAKNNTSKRDWRYLREKIQVFDSVIIFGYGKIGKELFSVMENWQYKVVCFIDNDTKKQGEFFRGCEVLNMQNALNKYKEAAIINASPKYKKAIRKQLINEGGVSSVRIIDYAIKNEIYYMSLSPKWYAYEFNDLCVKMFGWNICNSELDILM